MPSDIFASSRRLRRKKIIIKVIFLLLAVLIFSGAVIAFFYIPKFRVKEIYVNDENISLKEQIESEIREFISGRFFGIIPCDNIFIFPKEKILAAIMGKDLSLKKIDIDLDFPQKIFVASEKRKPEALWCLTPSVSASSSEQVLQSSGDSCAFVDEEGFIFQPAPFFSGSIFLKFFDERKEPSETGKEMLPALEFKKLTLLDSLLSGKNINITKINLKEGGIYEVYTKEGWYILINDKNNPDDLSANLGIILDTIIRDKRPNLEYIDLRFGKKVFYKFK